MSLNKLLLIGYVGADPEIRTLQGGQSVANVTLATTERGYKTRDGRDIPERTEWHNLVIWGKSAEVAENYVKKGTQLYVEGKIRTRSWDDNGVTRYRTEVLVDNFEILGRKSDNNEQSAGPAQAPRPQPGPQAQGNPDDLPF